MKTSSVFSPGEDSTRITLSGTFRLITEMNPPFLPCPRLMFSAPQYSVFPAGCSYRTPGIKNSLCKTTINSLPGNSSSRYSMKLTSKALHTEEAFSGLFDFSIASKASSGEILLQSQKQTKVTWCEIWTGVWCRCSQPRVRVVIWFCVAVTESDLSLSSNNRTPDLRSPGRFFPSISTECHSTV
ncbi:hypothetical protein TNCV_4478601 [Trichonephila clavipes]|nr:hypothetical protein TNCV_4478601 [Trichonephila clavipes]